MRYLFKLRPFYSNHPNHLLLLHFHLSKFQPFRLFLVHSKSSKLHKPKKTEQTHTKNPTETNNVSSLFDEITEILGTESLISDNTAFGFPISSKTHVGNAEIRVERPYSVPGVCGNATLWVDLKKGNKPVLGDTPSGNSGDRDVCRIAHMVTEIVRVENGGVPMDEQLENASVDTEKAHIVGLGDTHVGNLGDRDVSPIVHKVTEIVRGENGRVPMEEQLESAGFEIDVEIVEKVLKRCFKVPHLGLRFFNWVKIKTGFCHTTETYNTMIYIAGEAKEFGLVEELVEEMEKNSCQKDCKTWTILILHYGKAKLIGNALLIFEKMRKSGLEPDVVVYKLILRLLCSAQRADIAMEFYKEMVHKDMGISLYKLLLKCLTQSGDIAAAYLVAEDMIKICEIPERDTYACMLRSFCISGRIREALELIRVLKHKNLTLDAEIFETLVKGLCRADMIPDALEIVDIMKSKNSVDGKIYGIIINGFLRRNDLSNAFDLFQTMKDSGHAPTTSTYTELMQHLFRLNEFQRADKVYREMLENGVEIDSVAVTAIVAGHLHQNRISEAWDVLERMEANGIRLTRKSYTVFIKELSKVSQTGEILKVLNKMQASNITIGDNILYCVRSCLEKKGEMEKLEKVKQVQGASKLHLQEGKTCDKGTSGNQELGESLNSSKIQQGRPNSLTHKSFPVSYSDHDLQEICKILSSSEDWCSMQEALEKCTAKFTPELILKILHNCGLYGHVALHFFSWVGKQAGYNHTSDTYNMAIKIAGRAKDFKHMRSLFYEMKRIGCTITSDTWTIMIMQYGRAGLTEIALKVFREMKASGCKPDGSTYKYLIISLCGRKGRKVDEAITTFQEMIRVGFVPDKELVEIYLDCLCGLGKLLDARSCAESLTKGGFTVPLAYSLYARALCRAGRLEEASALVDEVGSDRHTLAQYTYGSLVHGLLQKDRLEEALAKVESMKQLGINPTVHVYTSLIVHFLKEQQIDKALEIFENMKVEGCEPTIVTYSVLIRGYMSSGKLVDAWNVFNHIKLNGPFPDFKTYSMFITCLCRVGKSEEALQLISDMLETRIVPSAINFQTVFFGLNREGKQHLAHNVLRKKWDLTKRRKFSV